MANVLTLDRLCQEVSLKEKPAKSGKVLKKRFVVGLISGFPNPGTTVRPSYMSVACVQYMYCMYMYVPSCLYVIHTCICLFACVCVCVCSFSLKL